jgi:ribose 5-phosphate isomerase A
MRVGLGTGSTSVAFIKALGERVKAGLKIRCVASSDASEALGRSLGMTVVSLAELPGLDVYIDGADEVAPGLVLIKGGGGALLREKIVASAAEKFIVVVDQTKIVGVLGKFPLPVEVIKMALPVVEPKLVALGLNPKQRQAKDGRGPYLTDEGNYILDCA